MISFLIAWTIAVTINIGALWFCYKMSKLLGWQRLWLVFTIMPAVAIIFRISAIINLWQPNEVLLFAMNYVIPIIFSISCLIYTWHTYRIFRHHFGQK